MRLEQRIGRVDRIGQRRPVHVIHLIARGSGESQVLSRLQSRVAIVRADIGGADPLGATLGDSGDPGDNEADVINHVWGPRSSPKTGQGGKRDPTPYETGTLWTPSLASDAQTEAGRLAMTRALAKAGDEHALAGLEGLGPAVSRARHWQTRTELKGRTVMVWQVVAADASGRVVGSTIVPVIVADRRRHDDQEMLRRVEEAAARWREAVATNHCAFINTRLLREQAIGVDRGLSASALFQPGLFERRRERAHSAAVATQDDADRDHAERMAAIDHALDISFLPPQLMLVLTP
jgi:hypothetical protein